MSIPEIILAIIAIVVGVAIGYFVHKRIIENQLDAAHETAQGILADAKKQAETDTKEALLEAKDESHRYRSEVERDLKRQRGEVQKQEDRVLQREEALDRKDNAFQKREDVLERKENKLNSEQQKLTKLQQQADSLVEKRQAAVEEAAALSQEEAQSLIINEAKQALSSERAKMIKESNQKAAEEADTKAKELIVQAIQRSGADMVSDTTVSVVTLPNDDMKGRIIGREGRNIRTLETLTGIDLIIDDTPEAVVLSGFDPIRREVAKIALEKLIQDGRIHPARIEEMVEKARKELDEQIQDLGEQTVFDLGIHSMHPALIKLVGQMNYRISYGQNVLTHAIEVAKLSGVFAAELGEDVTLAKRAGLLHDIGKAVENDVEESHVQIGIDLAKKYKESPVVIDAISAHESTGTAHYVISELVAAANTISASRPGARSDSLESFIHRLEKLENIANEFDGVKKSFAIQAGREVRVIVKPNKISDLDAVTLAHDIKEKIESDMDYPGHIKVSVIREVRSVAYAK
ncbi:ribonuclease Y [Secundilactobacillus folii]|uniref:Ribonuclease Y n=1 Tax=Secundilactobacillus folii TaxID=2678357 RepID=A0A7X2XXM9_9LACO|nr:ribonuclease Y [Secundilactobacillus folii]MTV82990.1 ribonuclease Y [Secundilactobacillus folii]